MFGWFRKRAPQRFRHEEFGELKLDHGFWCGEIAFRPADATIQIFVRDADGKPVPGASAALQEFGRRYDEIRPAFAAELRELFAPWHKEFWRDNAPLEDGEQLLVRFQLSSVEIDSKGITEVEFGLKAGWDDARFRLSLDGWAPKGLGVDD